MLYHQLYIHSPTHLRMIWIWLPPTPKIINYLKPYWRVVGVDGNDERQPRKCVSLAFRQFRKHVRSRDGCIPLRNTIYSPYDPNLKISGCSFRSLFPHTMGQKNGDPGFTNLSDAHFIFLGICICPDIWDKCTNASLPDTYLRLIHLMYTAPVNWVCQALVISIWVHITA